MNGVCVQWKGRINLEKLDGIGCLEFDEERAMVRNGYKILLLSSARVGLNTIRVMYVQNTMFN